MILFYSDYCEHCSILLDTIKRHDKDKKIKLLSIDYLRSINKNIDPRIHSVPALMFIKTKELIFGKAVFDYLLLPNRGILFASQHSTRDKEKIAADKNIKPSLNTNDDIIDEPIAFSLGSILSDNFSSIDDNELNNKDKSYNWTNINSDNNAQPDIKKTPGINVDDKITNKLPSIEEILQQREKDIK